MISECEMPNVLKSECEMPIAECKMLIAECEMPIAEYEIQNIPHLNFRIPN